LAREAAGRAVSGRRWPDLGKTTTPSKKNFKKDKILKFSLDNISKL
jgi:hypothetical protein